MIVTSLSFPLFLLLSSFVPSITAQGQGLGGFQTAESSTSITSSSTSSPQSSTSSTPTSTSASSGATPTDPTALGQGTYGPCVDPCLDYAPVVNHCNGTETGSALDYCQCRSFTPSNDPLINCILNCNQGEQYNFANTLPKLCAQTIFLGLNLTSTPKPWAENPIAAATFVPLQHIATAVPAATAIDNPAPNAAPTIGAAAGNLAGMGAVAFGVAFLL